MNILFFLTPKSEVAYVFNTFSIRETMKVMAEKKFSCIPVLNSRGEYVGSISEGDLLWGIDSLQNKNRDEILEYPISKLNRKNNYKTVTIESNMEDLFDGAINQNFVPVVDDSHIFIGIITRKAILKYCYGEIKDK